MQVSLYHQGPTFINAYCEAATTWLIETENQHMLTRQIVGCIDKGSTNQLYGSLVDGGCIFVHKSKSHKELC